jgi:hypothetical protein
MFNGLAQRLRIGILAAGALYAADQSTPIPAPTKEQQEKIIKTVRSGACGKYYNEIESAVKRHIPKELMSYKEYFQGRTCAVIRVESEFNPHATSRAQANGLMQVRYGPFSPKENIDKGMQIYMAGLEEARKQLPAKELTDEQLILTDAYYNSGISKVNRNIRLNKFVDEGYLTPAQARKMAPKDIPSAPFTLENFKLSFSRLPKETQDHTAKVGFYTITYVRLE